jgi:integrase
LTEQQLELFKDGPFSVRLPFPEALRIFWEFYWGKLPSASVTKKHRDRLATYFRAFYLDTISKADIEAFRASYKAQGLSEPTANKAHMLVTRLYNKFWEWKEAGTFNGFDFSKVQIPPKDKNPGKLAKKVNERAFARKVVLTKEKINRLTAWAIQLGDNDLAEIIWGLYWFRLRQSDFFRLTSVNVDTNHWLLEGIQHKTLTTFHPSGVPFRVMMTGPGKELIERRLSEVKPGTPLFRRSNLQKRFTTIRRLAGLEYATLQDLRRSAATYLLDNGVDAQTVAEGLGHTTQRMLPTYTPRTLRHHREASELLTSTEK